MKSETVIDYLNNIKNTASNKQMYELASNLRKLERVIDYKYKLGEEVELKHFTILLQSCLVGIPEDQSLLLKPIIRELKLRQIL
jgi:hypothetical protein